jgi:hypothetical protein
MNWKECGRRRRWSIPMYYFVIFLEGRCKTAKSLLSGYSVSRPWFEPTCLVTCCCHRPWLYTYRSNMEYASSVDFLSTSLLLVFPSVYVHLPGICSLSLVFSMLYNLFPRWIEPIITVSDVCYRMTVISSHTMIFFSFTSEVNRSTKFSFTLHLNQCLFWSHEIEYKLHVLLHSFSERFSNNPPSLCYRDI